MNNLQNMTDEALMVLLKRGTKSAFEELYVRYSKDLLAFIYRMVNGNEAASQDILQDVFVVIIEKPYLFDTDRRFKSWVYTVAANSCRKFHRQNAGHRSDMPSETHQGTDEQPNLRDRTFFNASLARALNQLSIEHKETFILKHQKHLSIKEIADVLSIPEGTVKSRLYTASRQLAIMLKHFNPNTRP